MTRLSRLQIFAVPPLIGILSSCSGGDGSGLDTGTMPTDPGPPAASFSEIQAAVFTPTCATSGCHSGAGAPQGLRLDEVNSYSLLVNQPSSELPSILRVEPFNPDGSYLIQKLEGTAAVGGQMPLGGPPLSSETIASIRQWIAEGAIDDRSITSATFSVVAISPMPDERLNSMPTQIIAIFNRAVDPSTVNEMTFIVEASGGDGTFSDGNEFPVQAGAIDVSMATPKRASFRIQSGLIRGDSYRIQLRAAGSAGILDMNANALDSDFESIFTVVEEAQE